MRCAVHLYSINVSSLKERCQCDIPVVMATYSNVDFYFLAGISDSHSTVLGGSVGTAVGRGVAVCFRPSIVGAEPTYSRQHACVR